MPAEGGPTQPSSFIIYHFAGPCVDAAESVSKQLDDPLLRVAREEILSGM